MAALKIVGYETGFKKVVLASILKEALELDSIESNKMTDAIMSGNVISLKFEDEEFANNLAEELVEAGAKIDIESADED